MKGDRATRPCSGQTDRWTEDLRVEQGHQLKGAFRADIENRVWNRGRSLLAEGPAGLIDSCREGETGAPRQPRPRPQQRLFGGLSTPI